LGGNLGWGPGAFKFGEGFKRGAKVWGYSQIWGPRVLKRLEVENIPLEGSLPLGRSVFKQQSAAHFGERMITPPHSVIF